MSPARIAAVLLGLGLARLAAARAPAIELVAPHGGATLDAGAVAVLEWRAPSGLSGIEEWEAFLSVNGGASYAFRLTPHLDVALRRVSVRLPALPTADARLLLRFGDERHEVAVELPARFAIAAPAAEPPAAPARVAHFAVGEPARPGEPGVVSWTAGPRSGAQPVEVEAGEAPAGCAPGAARAPEPSAALAESATPTAVAAPAVAQRSVAPAPAQRRADSVLPPPVPLDPLARTQRLNE